MDATDAALIQAWKLFKQNSTDEVEAELDALLPTLIDAGYVQADQRTWRFTPIGIARAGTLTNDTGD